VFIYIVKRVHEVSSYEKKALTLLVNNSTKKKNNTNNDITSHLQYLKTKDMTYSDGSCLDLRLVQKGGGGLNQIKESISFLLDNWISNGTTDINKQ